MNFPEEPYVGQTVDADGSEMAFIKQILINPGELAANGNGEAQALSRVPTSASKYILRGVIYSKEISKDAFIDLHIVDFPIIKYMFKEDCGWTPCQLGDPITRFNRVGKVVQEPVLTLTAGPPYYVYNELCIDLPPQGEKQDERP